MLGILIFENVEPFGYWPRAVASLIVAFELLIRHPFVWSHICTGIIWIITILHGFDVVAQLCVLSP